MRIGSYCASMLVLVAAGCSSSSSSPTTSTIDAGSNATDANTNSITDVTTATDASNVLASMTIGAAGGTLTVTAAQSATLAGTSITFPPDALPTDTTISIRAGSQAVAVSPQQAAGPVVDFEPSGLAFTTSVNVTIPFALPSGAAQSDLSIEAVEADGTRSNIAVTTATSSLATFSIIGFTSYGPIVMTPGRATCSTNADCTGGAVCVSGTCSQ